MPLGAIARMQTANEMCVYLITEELLYTNQAFWFSPDNQYLVYGVFDESHLPVQEYPYYGADEDVYGETVHIAYPKVLK